MDRIVVGVMLVPQAAGMRGCARPCAADLRMGRWLGDGGEAVGEEEGEIKLGLGLAYRIS